jgi:hypothetical protein
VTVPDMTTRDAATGQRDIKSHETTSFADLGKEMWSYLTGKGAAINYEFVDMTVPQAHPGFYADQPHQPLHGNPDHGANATGIGPWQ